ncbi:MAG TPA: AMP-binding protein [Verrucomicrobiae bacterium]|jgi:phenylacetate-coenzyme A ligase PaaK-like adenylate-forming protein|nr:AMP-binding protein [Verrucomicrobiae bacterium]
MNFLWTQWHNLSETAGRQRQAARLRQYLRDSVLPFSAHYRELFRENNLTADSIQSLDDLAKIPFTSKTDLLNTPEHPERVKDFLLIPDEKTLSRRPGTICRTMLRGLKSVRKGFEAEFRPIFMTFTTGRAAEPVPFLYSQQDLKILAEAGRRVMEVCGAQPDQRLLNAFPYAPHLAFWLTHYAGTEFGAMMFSCGGGKVMGTDGTLRLIQKLKPDNLIGIPTFLYHVLSQAVAEGVQCKNLANIVLGGEKVSDGLRQKLRELARALGAENVNILATYGFTEAKMAFAECQSIADSSKRSGGEKTGYHLYPDLGIVEIIDPKTGQPVPNGQPGEIVFTPLASRGSVVLRYRTGDYIDGGLTWDGCPTCHRLVPRLVGNISRSSEVREMHLDKIKGTLVDFNELEHCLDGAPHVGAWQLELRKTNDDPHERDEIILHVQNLDSPDESRLARELSDRCYKTADVHPNKILFHDAEKMRELQGVGTQIKEQKLVDHRPKTK